MAPQEGGAAPQEGGAAPQEGGGVQGEVREEPEGGGGVGAQPEVEGAPEEPAAPEIVDPAQEQELQGQCSAVTAENFVDCKHFGDLYAQV